MSMGKEVEIRGEGGQLKIEIFDYENPHSESVDDRNWLDAQLAVKAGPFSGTLRFAITAVELEMLHQRLAAATRTLSESVSFTTMEGSWTFELKFGRTGEAIIEGVVTPDLGSKTSLRYELRTDAISVETFVQQLGGITAEFPAAYA